MVRERIDKPQEQVAQTEVFKPVERPDVSKVLANIEKALARTKWSYKFKAKEPNGRCKC